MIERSPTSEDKITMIGGLQKHQTPRNDGICPCINSAAGMGGGQTPIAIRPSFRVRKLTQKECWRLMGFQDQDFERAKSAMNENIYGGADRSGSQLYKQAGNSIVVDVLCAILDTSSPTLIDLRGKTFGKLKVIEKDPDSKPGKAKWVCECKCGNIVSVFSDSLRNGKTRSCGCARSQIKHDLTNQAFGFLKVIEPVKNERIKGNETRWKCLCQNCGRTVEVSSYWLRHSDPYGHCKCTRFNKPL